MGVQLQFLVFLGDEESLEQGAVPGPTLELASRVHPFWGGCGVAWRQDGGRVA